MGKANRNNENIFKWSINRKSDRHNSAIKHHNSHKTVKNKYPNYSSYSIIPTSEVTQGAIEVWATLPDEIRQDPSLASFRQEHERIHGGDARDEQDPLPSDEDVSLHDNRTTIPTIVISKQPTIETTTIDVPNGIDKLPNGESMASNKQHQLHQHHNPTRSSESDEVEPSSTQKIFNNFKIAFLVAVWLLFTGILMSKDEKELTYKQLSIPANKTKSYDINSRPIGARLGVIVHGAFDEDNTNVSENFLFIRLQLLHLKNDEPNGDYNASPAVRTSAIAYRENDQIEYSIPIVGDIDQIDFVHETMKLQVVDIKEAMLNQIDGDQTKLQLRIRTNLPISFPIRLAYDTTPIDKSVGVIYAAVILLGLYVMIIWEIVHRTFAAMIASTTSIGILALMNERPTMPELMSWIDVETLLLLFGMMILVAILSETGVFDYLAVFAYKITNGQIWPLINCLCLFTAILSSFLDNVTTVLLMTPVTIRLCEVMQLNPVPILMSMVIFSNIGGTLTPVGDPPNVIIASNSVIIRNGITFMTFTVHMAIGVFFIMIQTYIQLRIKFRNLNDLRFGEPQDIQELRQEIAVWQRAAASLSSYSKDEDIVRETLQKKVKRLSRLLKQKLTTGSVPIECYRQTLEEMQKKYPIRNRSLLIKSIIVLIFVIGFFFLHSIPNIQRLSLGWTALLGAVLLLILSDRQDMEAVLARVEWSTLLFFAALFVLMEALSMLGLIEWIGSQVENLILSVGEESRLTIAILIILWVSAIASAFVDNIPLTTMMLKVTISLADKKALNLPLQPLVWALAIGACIGGNGSLIGASANVVCAGVAEQHGYRFTFIEYFKVGFPIMLGSITVATVYLLIAHVLFAWH